MHDFLKLCADDGWTIKPKPYSEYELTKPGFVTIKVCEVLGSVCVFWLDRTLYYVVR